MESIDEPSVGSAALAHGFSSCIFPACLHLHAELERRVRSTEGPCESHERPFQVGIAEAGETAPARAQALAVRPRLRQDAARELVAALTISRCLTLQSLQHGMRMAMRLFAERTECLVRVRSSMIWASLDCILKVPLQHWHGLSLET